MNDAPLEKHYWRNWLEMSDYLGIDVGGTNLKYALVSKTGAISDSGACPTPDNKHDLIRVLHDLIAAHRRSTGVGICVPGFVDPQAGYLRSAGALHYLAGSRLRDELGAVTDRPIWIENDANCAAISEAWTGNAIGLSDFVCITIGTGIGGAIVLGGALYRGTNFSAGEFGRVIQGVTERTTISDTSAIRPARAAYAGKHGIDMGQVSGRLAMSDPEIYQECCRRIGLLVYNLIQVLNPERILLGGEISREPAFIADIRRAVSEYDVWGGIDYDIRECANGNDAGLQGAVYELRKHLESTARPSPSTA